MPVALGRTRELVFNGDGALRFCERDRQLRVAVRDSLGRLVIDAEVEPKGWSVMGYRYWTITHTFVGGSYSVTATDDEGRRYAADFEVALDEVRPTRIDVPVVGQ